MSLRYPTYRTIRNMSVGRLGEKNVYNVFKGYGYKVVPHRVNSPNPDLIVHNDKNEVLVLGEISNERYWRFDPKKTITKISKLYPSPFRHPCYIKFKKGSGYVAYVYNKPKSSLFPTLVVLPTSRRVLITSFRANWRKCKSILNHLKIDLIEIGFQTIDEREYLWRQKNNLPLTDILPQSLAYPKIKVILYKEIISKLP